MQTQPTIGQLKLVRSYLSDVRLGWQDENDDGGVGEDEARRQRTDEAAAAGVPRGLTRNNFLSFDIKFVGQVLCLSIR